MIVFFKKIGPTPAYFCLFLVFSNKQYYFYNTKCEKCNVHPVYDVWDSNPQPLELESSPIITRTGLPPRTFKTSFCTIKHLWLVIVFFYKAANPGLFLPSFSVFFKQTPTQFIKQIHVKKCQSSIHCWDSNPRPSICESHPITNRPGFPAQTVFWM